MRIGLVGCVKSKRAVPAPAADLYTSPLFLGRRAFVEAGCDRWYVLSALHGLVRPEQILDPYDRTLNNATSAERREWSQNVIDALGRELGSLRGLIFEIHAGRSYTDFGVASGLRRDGAHVELPVAGLGLGQQLAFYARASAPLGSHTQR